MAAISAVAAGSWYANRATVWSSGNVPAATDDVDLAGYAVVMDIARIPASGSLASLTSPGTAGYLSVPMNVLGNCEIHADVILGSIRSDGVIEIGGSAVGSTLQLYYHSLTGGTVTSGRGVYSNAICNIIFNGPLYGGSAGYTYAFYMNMGNSNSNVTINGDITGGSYANAVQYLYAPGKLLINGNIVASEYTFALNLLGIGTYVTLGPYNIINTTYNAISGYALGAWNAGYDNYISFPFGKFPALLPAGKVVSGQAHGDITGTRVDCPAAQAVVGAAYGDPAAQTAGTYHEATAAEVEAGVEFGPASAYTGEYVGGSSNKLQRNLDIYNWKL